MRLRTVFLGYVTPLKHKQLKTREISRYNLLKLKAGFSLSFERDGKHSRAMSCDGQGGQKEPN